MNAAFPIITYHSLDDSGSVISITPVMFREQMKILHRSGIRTATLSEVADWLRAGEPPPPKTVALTFDDAYENVFTEGFPVLREFGFTATVFIIPEFCGRTNLWPGHQPPSPALHGAPLASWRQLSEMREAGIECGAHTLTHPDLRQLDDTAAHREIDESAAVIARELGERPRAFAYPYGLFSPRDREIVSQSYDLACTTRLGKVGSGCDPSALPRLDAFFLKNPRTFEAAVSGSRLDLYFRFRDAARQLRSRFEI